MRFVSTSGMGNGQIAFNLKRKVRGSGRARKWGPFGIIIRHPLKYPVYDDRQGNFAWTVSRAEPRESSIKSRSWKEEHVPLRGYLIFRIFHRGSSPGTLIIRGCILMQRGRCVALENFVRRTSRNLAGNNFLSGLSRISFHFSFFSTSLTFLFFLFFCLLFFRGQIVYSKMLIESLLTENGSCFKNVIAEFESKYRY